MAGKKAQFDLFKVKSVVSRSLIDDMQKFMHMGEFDVSSSLIHLASRIIPSHSEVESARKEAPFRMFLRGETRHHSATEEYRTAINDLKNELVKMQRDSRKRSQIKPARYTH